MIVGGIASRVASEVLQGGASQLRLLTPHFVDYLLTFYGVDRPDQAARVASPAAGVPTAYAEERRKQAGA